MEVSTSNVILILVWLPCPNLLFLKVQENVSAGCTVDHVWHMSFSLSKFIPPALKQPFFTLFPNKASFKNFWIQGWRTSNCGHFVIFYLFISVVSHSKSSWSKTCLKFVKIHVWWACNIQSYFEAGISVWYPKMRPPNSRKCKN